jgi:hypothetical protein
MRIWRRVFDIHADVDNPNPNPLEADGSVIVDPQLEVCLRASVIGKPWSRGGTTGVTPSTTAGATPSTTTGVLASTRSTGCYFSSELLLNTAIFSRSDLE